MKLILGLLAACLLTKSSTVLGLSNIKNVIYVVPDGYGPSSQTMARDFVAFQQTGINASHPLITELAADRLVIGTVRTHSANHLVTDSAAAATAFASGVKTKNYGGFEIFVFKKVALLTSSPAVGVNPAGEPVASILEAAKLAGYKTGLVVTSTIYDGTPAAYAAHVADRYSVEAIAAQQIGYSHPFGPTVDVFLGGGQCYYKPESAGGCRKDGLELLKFATSKGYHVMQDRAAFDNFTKSSNASLPYLGLFSKEHLMYEIDRSKVPEEEPSLVERVDSALKSLHEATSKSTKGFFIMIEASRIDHSGHRRDAATQVHDTIITTPCLNTWPAQHSVQHAQVLYNAFIGTDTDRASYLTSTLLPAIGFGSMSPTERDQILQSLIPLTDAKDMIAERADVGWASKKHSASDVTLHGYAAGAKGREFKADMAGNHDNTDLPKYLAKLLGLDLEGTTRKLRARGSGWVPLPQNQSTTHPPSIPSNRSQHSSTMVTAVARVLSTYELLTLILQHLPNSGKKKEHDENDSKSSDAKMSSPPDNCLQILALRGVSRIWAHTISTSLELRRLTWHAPYVPPPNTPYPIRSPQGGVLPFERIIDNNTTYFYRDTSRSVIRSLDFAPNPVIAHLKIYAVKSCGLLLLDFDDGCLPATFGNACWASMYATRPECTLMLITLVGQRGYWLVSTSGALRVGDLVYALNKVYKWENVTPGGHDAEVWCGTAWPMEVRDAEVGTEAERFHRKLAKSTGRGGVRLPKWFYVGTEGVRADVYVVKKEKWWKRRRCVVAARRLGGGGYKEVELDDEEWAGDLERLFAEA
ncbi:alkaline-phosphatase-like protein [Massariosphaeria phaeospora]|uniref:Alkaline phosphatase n=1 Tax=Massariosphaeria phaeospora TaxID=100035 RepID=A0A7C8MQT3_9PLEO|nr:alkaline-phosphatase-like protein [Massariosphaeria phaeospora]